MKYYIFRVQDNLGQEYYILNNMYIGYVGFDSDHMRSRAEYHGFKTDDFFKKIEDEKIVTMSYGSKSKCKRKYQLFAVGDVVNDEDLHKWNCDSKRFSLEEAEKIAQDFRLTLSKNTTWYEVYYPNKNSSECYLREIGGKQVIK